MNLCHGPDGAIGILRKTTFWENIMKNQFENLKFLDKQTCFARAGPEPPPSKFHGWNEFTSKGPP
jgi:hypothetical protein